MQIRIFKERSDYKNSGCWGSPKH